MELQETLARGGFDVVGLAGDGDSAVRLAGELAPSLVLMDIRLAAGGDGIESAIRILDLYGIRSLFVSGHLDAATRRRAESARPLAILDKPVPPADLLQVVTAALGL